MGKFSIKLIATAVPVTALPIMIALSPHCMPTYIQPVALKKRAHDIGGNAIGVYDYREKRRVFVNQQGYKVETKNKLIPKTEYVLVKENQKVAKITADVFKCRKST